MGLLRRKAARMCTGARRAVKLRASGPAQLSGGGVVRNRGEGRRPHAQSEAPMPSTARRLKPESSEWSPDVAVAALDCTRLGEELDAHGCAVLRGCSPKTNALRSPRATPTT